MNDLMTFSLGEHIERLELPVCQLLEDLASDSPEWGGGGAVIMGASMGVALYAMALSVTYRSVLANKFTLTDKFTPDMLLAMSESFRTGSRYLAQAARGDGELYSKVVEAMRLPKDDGDKRAVALKVALRQAIEEPLKVAKDMVRMMQLIATVRDNCKKANYSDIINGTYLLMVGVRGTLANVRQNCGTREEFAQFKKMCDDIEREAEQSSAELYNWLER